MQIESNTGSGALSGALSGPSAPLASALASGQLSPQAFQALLARASASASATDSGRTNSSASTTTDSTQATYDSLVAELHDWLKKSPIEHMREQILKEMGLTEADVAAMPPEKRAAVEEAIAEKIRERLAALNGRQGKGGDPTASKDIQTLLNPT